MHNVPHLLQNHINSAAVCNIHNTSLVVWICCTRKPTQLQNSSKVHHSAVCVQPQIQHMWLTTHADCSILHQPTRSTCHLSVSLTQCWSLLSCETLRDTSATLMHITAEIRSTQHRWTAARPQDHHVSLTDQQQWDDRRQSSLLCDVFRRWTTRAAPWKWRHSQLDFKRQRKLCPLDESPNEVWEEFYHFIVNLSSDQLRWTQTSGEQQLLLPSDAEAPPEHTCDQSVVSSCLRTQLEPFVQK